MKTKEINDNKTLRTGVIVAAIAVITFIALVMTFAKYASQGTGEDTTRVARWGVNAAVPTDLDLFDGSYTGTGGQTTVDSSDKANVIAPGTSKMQTINLASFIGDQAPEVMYHFEPTLTIVDQSTTSTQTISILEKLNQDEAFTWKLVSVAGVEQSYQTYQELQSAVAAMGEPDIAPNHFPSNFGGNATPQIKIGWNWDFEYNGTSNDPSDTEIGNLAASETLTGLNTTLTLNAYQCQGCAPVPTTLSGTITSTDGAAVVDASVTYNYTTANGSATATTDGDGKYTMSVPKNTKGSLTVEKLGYKTQTIDNISINDQPVIQNVTNFDTKTEVEIPTPITDLKYNGEEQTGITYNHSLIPGTYTYTGVVSATGATKSDPYSATFSLKDPDTCMWKGGATGDQTIKWTIAKADNPMDFPDQDDNTSVESSEDIDYTFNKATGVPDDLSVTYDASSTASSQQNFYIPDHENNVVVCAGGTGVDTYTVYLTAKSGNDNYNSKEITKSFKWTVEAGINYKPIQTKVDGTNVTFLPAYSGTTCPYGFYTDPHDETSKISGITNMASLKTAIEKAGGADKVYTDAKSSETQTVTFYGTLDKKWDEVFNAWSGTSWGLKSDFKDKLNEAGVETVYFSSNEDPTALSDWNWDANNTAREGELQPMFDKVVYNDFYGAYKGLLSSYANYAWSSRALNQDAAYCWYVDGPNWKSEFRTGSYAVVLSKDF